MSKASYILTALAIGFLGSVSGCVNVKAQVTNPGVQQSGSVAANDCVKWGPGTGQIQSFGSPCASGGSVPAALTHVDDTNVTLTLGGTPATALLQATSITAGWAGTLAAARLNSNVVQSAVNDTNVTGSISAQALTLGWTGTLAASRGGTGLSSLGTGVATWLGTPSSANLAAAVTGETGSGALVFGTAPTLAGATLTGLTAFTGGPTTALNDVSSVVGSKTAFFGGEVGSTAQIHKLNVLYLGGATVMSRDGKADQLPAPTTLDWLATLLPWTTPNAQLASLSGPGIWGMVGGSRSSDYRTWSGASNSGLTIGVGGFGINDDTNNNTAWGGYYQANRNSGAGPTWGIEIALANFGSVPNVDPYSFFPTGYNAALLLESGAGYPQASDGRAPTNASSALSISNNGAAFNKGVIFKSGALDTAVGAGTGGVAIETAAGQSWRVLSAAATVGAEMWGSSAGWTMNQPLTVANIIGGTAAGSSLTVKATSGVGAGSEFIALQVGNNGALEVARATQSGANTGVLALGATTPQTGVAGVIYPQLQSHTITTTIPIGIYRWTNDNGGPQNQFMKSRGTSVGTHTVVQSGDILGSFNFSGSDGTAFRNGARIQTFVDGTPGASDMPGRLTIETTPDGSVTPSIRIVIGQDGGVNIGATTTNVGAGVLKIEGTTDSTSSTTGIFQTPGGGSFAKALWVGTYVSTTPTTVGALPACGAGTKGARMFVTDELAAVAFNTVATGSGANNVPVFCDGTNWRIG